MVTTLGRTSRETRCFAEICVGEYLSLARVSLSRHKCRVDQVRELKRLLWWKVQGGGCLHVTLQCVPIPLATVAFIVARNDHLSDYSYQRSLIKDAESAFRRFPNGIP